MAPFWISLLKDFTGTSRVLLCGPSDEWSGRAAVDWRDASRGATARIRGSKILEVTQALDAIYEHARH
jgi:hypothetical protein